MKQLWYIFALIMALKTVVWRLSAGLDRRFRGGHPWAYSNEVQGGPKGVEPGAPVELQDAGGKFLARGYGNPNSLIAFRALSRNAEEKEPGSAEGLLNRLKAAAALRARTGMTRFSHRWVFGEADYLPGLIIDRYRLEGKPAGQVIVIQAHTAGADRWLSILPELLQQLIQAEGGAPLWSRTSIVIRNDLGVRTLEGLQEEAPRVLKQAEAVNLSQAHILVRPASGTEPIVFEADLVSGQKTGFFLDQTANVAQWVGLWTPPAGKVRILDLCSYVGQWSAQLARAYRQQGREVEVTAVDASATALEFARQNVKAQGAQFTGIKGDVLKDLEALPERSFDIVISDPPALIKGRKAIPAGTRAYLQLNTQVFRLVASGGGVVACSCSSLLEEEVFVQQLSKAAHRNGRQVQWVGRGGQAPDHPALSEFPEGRYLKAFFGGVT